MLERVRIPGVEIPRLYVATNQRDALLAQDNGIPYIVWKNGSKDLIKHILRPALEEMFPYIKWDKVLGKKDFRTKVVNVPGREVTQDISDDADKDPEVIRQAPLDNGVADIAESERLFNGAVPTNKRTLASYSLKEYLGDVNSMVNLEVLQELELMPKFIGDIVDCIKKNLVAPVRWTEGYNKKLGVPVGNFSRVAQLPNLIILDVSGSIPRGIAATMIALIDTLRTQVSAELIITSDISRYYTLEDELPDPESIRREFGLGNESKMFVEILKEKIAGREWGNVISFGDNDTPFIAATIGVYNNFLSDTRVHCVRHYHTGYRVIDEPYTGYAKWCTMYTKDMPEVTFSTSWCKVIQ